MAAGSCAEAGLLVALDPVDADPLLSVDGVGGLGSRVVELGAPLTADHSPTEFTGTE